MRCSPLWTLGTKQNSRRCSNYTLILFHMVFLPNATCLSLFQVPLLRGTWGWGGGAWCGDGLLIYQECQYNGNYKDYGLLLVPFTSCSCICCLAKKKKADHPYRAWFLRVTCSHSILQNLYQSKQCLCSYAKTSKHFYNQLALYLLFQYCHQRLLKDKRLSCF